MPCVFQAYMLHFNIVLWSVSNSLRVDHLYHCLFRAFDKFWTNDACTTVELDSRVCQALFIIRVIQSTLVLVFNLTVAAAVLSICRTHAIGEYRMHKTCFVYG